MSICYNLKIQHNFDISLWQNSLEESTWERTNCTYDKTCEGQIIAVLACTCQVFICLIKGRFWGWRGFLSTRTGSFTPRAGGTGGHCCHFHAAHRAHTTLHQQCCPHPLLCICLSLCNFMSCQKERKWDWLCGCWMWDGTFQWINNKWVCFHYLPQAPLTDHDRHGCALLALFVCSWPICYFHLLFFFKFTSYIMKSDSYRMAPFLFLLYAAYLVWKTEGLVPSTC